MEFLMFYIISTIITLIIAFIVLKGTCVSLQRQNEKFKKATKSVSFWEKLMFSLPCFVPCINCLLALFLICGGFLTIKYVVNYIVYGDTDGEPYSYR